jgi:hypothetical protein
MLLVEEIGGVLGDIGHSPGPQRNEGFAMFNVRLYKVNLVKASMHQAILIAFEPQRFNLVAGIVQQSLYKRFQVLLLAAHGSFIHHEQDLPAGVDARSPQDGGELQQGIGVN